MDSLTQFTFGAAISAACLGSKLGPRKAVLIGGLLGTLPDLDVLIPFETKIDQFVYHRGWSHSFFIHAVAAPVIGELILRLFKSLQGNRILVWMTVFLCLTTHALLDSMNAYGARVFWPFFPDPVGTGSIFIIDPVFTVPLLVAVAWAIASTNWSAGLKRILVASLVFSTGYLVWGLIVQQHVHARGKSIFAERGIDVTNVKTVVTPFNTLLWRVIGQADGEYYNLYVSLFDDDHDAVVYKHEFDSALVSCVLDDPEYQKMVWFSDGFVRTDLIDGRIIASDYRLGLTPSYIFRFAIAEYVDGQFKKISPEPILPSISNAGTEFGWLGNRISGRPSIRASEQKFLERNEVQDIAEC
ncbi:metal-dependent hydrolase [Roseibium porphyridii]|uniref:Metal-dependent hydrolase n=1 Tax=Roseibium porphyridii TaxID=2866279 RepID=A0ABY8F7A2_9HYPH|nr:metal-dependent hydrolase [Roseibium sp. KMA01]WFE91342.1 metal-dependent hydrolase [Roseibium sp. KMA01]